MLFRARRRLLLTAALVAASACTDQSPNRPAEESRIVGGVSVREVGVGAVENVLLECRDRDGRIIRGARTSWIVNSPTWPSERPGRVTLDVSGSRLRVIGVAEGTVYLLGGCLEHQLLREALEFGGWYSYPVIQGIRVDVVASSDTSWAIDGAADTLRLRAPSPDDSLTDVSQLLTVRSASGTQTSLEPLGFSWSSDDDAVATIARDGLVRARAPGTTTLRATRKSRVLMRPVRVDSVAPSGRWDIALIDAHWTQGAQDEANRIPIVLNGRAAAVNVLAHATPNAPASSVTLHVWNAAGQSVWSQLVPLAPSVDGAPHFAAPSAQFLVPRFVVLVAASWRLTLERNSDTDETFADANAINDRWPRAGALTLEATTAPPLRLRLVPIRLAGNNNYLVPITPDLRVLYDSFPRIRLPLGQVTITVEPPLTIQSRMRTAAELTADPSADAELWREGLDAVDARRLSSGAGQSDYWVGVLPKPTPESSTRWGGMAFFPSNARDVGPMSRSMLVRGHDWYPSQFTSGLILAHELGHNFGLRHAPCGDPSRPDPSYPVADGGVGNWVHWVSAWEHGSATRAATIAASDGDLMSYCSRSFIGPFHTRAILGWRMMADEAFAMAPSVSRVVSVRGSLTERGIVLRTPEFMDAEPFEVATGSILVEVLAHDGRVLLRGRARTGQLSEGTAVPFVAQLPIGSLRESDIARVRVTQGTRRAEAAPR